MLSGSHSGSHLWSNQCFLPKEEPSVCRHPQNRLGWVEIQQGHLGPTDGNKQFEHGLLVSWQLPSKLQQILCLQVLSFVTPQSAIRFRFQLIVLCHLIPRERVLESDLSCLSLERGTFKFFCLSIYPEVFEKREMWFSLLFISPGIQTFVWFLLEGQGNPEETLRLTRNFANPDHWRSNYASTHFQGCFTLIKPNLGSAP